MDRSEAGMDIGMDCSQPISRSVSSKHTGRVATRWTTEVAYHDCKQLLDFGRCQSVHFSAQIASFTLTMM